MVIGDPDIEGENEFHRNLGDALSSWQRVEGSAYGLFRAMMGKANQTLVSVVFHHIQSFESRVSMLDRCAYFAIQNDDLKKRWKDLRKRLENNSTNRNRIVHFSAGYTHSPEFTGYSLGPSHFNALYAINDRWKSPDFRIDSRRLWRMRHDFGKLADDLREFREDFERIAKKTSRTKRSRSGSAKSTNPSK